MHVQTTHISLANIKIGLRLFARWYIVPALLFGLMFFATQPHYIRQFSHSFYLDQGDGYQNVWNIWWVNHSLGEHGSNPYNTIMVEWPHGTSLLPQTMNIYNGLVGIVLQNFIGASLVTATNVAVASGFVLSGVTMFWFIYYLYRKYWISILSGALFTFSAYHFAHAQGHMQLTTLQWLPLFLLCFWALLSKPTYLKAVAAALSLLLVLFSDYYYFLWACSLGLLWLVWCLCAKELRLNARLIKRLAVFSILSLIFCGPFVIGLMLLNKRDPLLGFHDPVMFGLDPLAFIIPGGSWIFAKYTSWHWRTLPYMSEMSTYVAPILYTVPLYGLVRRKFLGLGKETWFWLGIFTLFLLLSLGPHPTSFGQAHTSIPMPYLLLEKILPTLKISGMPVRWALIAMIALVVLSANVLAKVNYKSKGYVYLLGVVIATSSVLMFPSRLPLASTEPESYINAVKALPYGALIDDAAESGPQQLFHQTIHERPIGFGYITRVPTSVENKNFEIFAALEQGRFDDICSKYKIRHVTTKKVYQTSYPVVYLDASSGIRIYDFTNSEACRILKQ